MTRRPDERGRVPSSTGAASVNFASPAAARRLSWIGGPASGSASGMPMGFDPTARRPSWTPTPLGEGGWSGKQRLFYPAHPEESGSGSGSNNNSDNNGWNEINSGSGSDEYVSGSSSQRAAAVGGIHDGGGGAGTGESSEEASNFRAGMQIDMKMLVGDAVGNMSISPTARDIVLAARRGLFIIDLASPLSVPRFLPQGGTWDVADVQWNPHVSRAEYIVSTSSEKLLIWNLLLPSPSYPSFSSSSLSPLSSSSPSSSSSPAASLAGHGTNGKNPAPATASAPSSISHVLHAHYRAITDINWHPAEAERDVVASTGIDSWIWAWDLRAAAGGRAVFGLCAFNAGGTQVKWNRQDPHVLASSHAGEVLIWDRRRGATRLYPSCPWRFRPYADPLFFGSVGLGCRHDDRHRRARRRAVWRRGLSARRPRPGSPRPVQHRTLCTDAHARPHHPHGAPGVARAAPTIWARSAESTAARGTGLGMYAFGPSPARSRASSGSSPQRTRTRARKRRRDEDDDSDSEVEDEGRRRRWTGGREGGDWEGDGEDYAGWGGDEPVEVFEGHTDVVKEFVWRRGGDGTAFQLITWSKDRTLRFWPVDAETMAKVGYVRPAEPLPGPISTPATTLLTNVLSGSAPTDTATPKKKNLSPPAPTFSFRNPPPPEPLDASILTGSVLGLTSPHIPALSAPVGARAILAGVRAGAPVGGGTKHNSTHNAHGHVQDARRTPGLAGSTTRMSRGTAGGRRVGMDALTWLSNVKEVAGGGGERSSSGGRGGAGSSGGVSEFERGDSVAGISRRRSDSRGRGLEAPEGQSLQDELTSVINKLVSAKIKLEKHDLTKKRNCTLGLHGPWGESSSVFIRITFTFPKDYPHGIYPRGTPTVELERNPLISLKNRAFILRRLRALRERQRPCLEACLRFLSEGEKSGAPHTMDSESSDEDQDNRKSRDLTVTLLRNHKNLAEPRTSQGTFGPNGELVCFFRAPPRIVRHVLRDLSISVSPAKTVSDIPTTGHDSVDLTAEHTAPRVFRSPALIAECCPATESCGDGPCCEATRSSPPPGWGPHPADHDQPVDVLARHVAAPSRLGVVTAARRGHRTLEQLRVPTQRSTVFITNTTHISGGDRKVAIGYVFEAETLAMVCQKNAEVAREHGRYDHERIFKILQALFPSHCSAGVALPGTNSLVVKMVTRIHLELCKMKDLQMLAMLSMIVLQGCRTRLSTTTKSPDLRGTVTPKYAGMDYFSLSRTSSGNNTGRMSPVSPTWPRLTASPPVTSGQGQLSTSNSSRGSWSSLFNAGSVRQFMSGMQDLKDGLTTPSEPPATSTIPVPKVDRISRGPDSPLPRRRAYWRDSGLPSPSAVSKSWKRGDFAYGEARCVVFDTIHEARVVLLDLPTGDKSDAFPAKQITEFMNHVYIYADVLFSWQLFHKRLELLKSVNYADSIADSAQHGIGMIRSCTTCSEVVEQGKNACRNCSRPCGMPHCTICRLPVKGLSRSCLRCFHVTHISCWRRLDVPICPSGCGCLCDNRGFAHGAPFASLPASSTPVTPPLPLAKDPT
ncbi:hypothetical protein B0H14DRAFT_3854291 [Mycena olivaceomarginata]|nr:hypothetical protein B0H14DRAFT_3854291 [Mycena olivaceomarginata]